MSLFFQTLQQETTAHGVEPCDEGFLITRKPGAGPAFDEIARRAINQAGDAFAAFPRVDGTGGYDSVLIVPIDT